MLAQDRSCFEFPTSRGGVSYFGLAEVYPKRKKHYLSDWLRDFINRHAATKSLRDFAFELRNELHTVVPPGILEKNASGFHICGYNAHKIPEFWYLSNIGGMDAFTYKNFAARYAEPTSDFLERDAKTMGWNGVDMTSIRNDGWMYRNGDLRVHAFFADRLDQTLKDLAGTFSEFSTPKTERDLERWVKFKFEVISYFYKKFAKRQIIGRPIDAFCLTKTLS
jgi:hypothetical protein